MMSRRTRRRSGKRPPVGAIAHNATVVETSQVKLMESSNAAPMISVCGVMVFLGARSLMAVY